MEEQIAPALDAAPKELVRTWTEAPNSANIRATIDGHDWQVTIRADTFKELSERIAFINKWVDQHNGNGKKQSSPVNPQSPSVAIPAPIPAAPSTSVAPAQITQVAPQIFTMHIERMETTPRADGKIDAKFFQADHKYPDLTAAKTPDSLVAMLAQTGQWTPAHFAAAAQFPVKFVVEWVNSDKLNKNGKPYKNIVSIKASA